MLQVLRTPEDRFAGIDEYAYEPHYHHWTEPSGAALRMHYVDEGQGPPVLMLHGQPDWGWLYHGFIPPLMAAGYRCIVPDYIGFGRSDKVVEDSWYVIERHCEAIRSLIDALDLRDVRIVVQDWGGPIGLRQVADMPARFSRLFILNTWLHHIDMQYSAQMRGYHSRMAQITPRTGSIFETAAAPQQPGPFGHAFRAPFPDERYMAGPRRFPLCHPYANPVGGNAVDQARCYAYLRSWPKPAHVIASATDPGFPAEQLRQWSLTFPFGTFDTVDSTPQHHFLQLTRAKEIVEIMLSYMH